MAKKPKNIDAMIFYITMTCILLSFGVIGGLVYTAIHFITKYW